MTAIWTPSKELWTPKHPAFRRRVSEWCRMAAGAVSTCGGKVNTKNGKVSTNAGQTGGCGCTTGPATCTVPAGSTYHWSLSGVSAITCATGAAAGTSSSLCYYSFPTAGTNQGGLVEIYVMTAQSSTSCGYSPLREFQGGNLSVVTGANFSIGDSNQDGYAFMTTIPTSGRYLVAGTYPNNATSLTTAPILGSGGNVTISYTMPTQAISSLPASIVVSPLSVTSTQGILPGGGGYYNAECTSFTTTGGLSGGTYALSYTACPSDSSAAIGVSYGPVIWGVESYSTGDGSFAAIDDKFCVCVTPAIGTGAGGPIIYSSSTLLGTYTTNNPNASPSTLTVSL